MILGMCGRRKEGLLELSCHLADSSSKVASVGVARFPDLTPEALAWSCVRMFDFFFVLAGLPANEPDPKVLA